MPAPNSLTNSSQSDHSGELTHFIELASGLAPAGSSRWELPVKGFFKDYRDNHPGCPAEQPALAFEEMQPQLLKGIYIKDVRVGYNAFRNSLVFERVPSPESMERNAEISDERYSTQLSEELQALTGFQFQAAVAEILGGLPWVSKVEETRLTADGGVDFRARVEDEILGRVIAIGQVKRTIAKTGSPAIREFIGTLVSATPKPRVGFFISWSGFTEPALRAIEDSPVHIRAVGGEELQEWLSEFEIGVKSKQLNVRWVDRNFWNEIRERYP